MDAIELMYPRTQLIDGMDRVFDLAEKGDTIIFDSILELDPSNTNDSKFIIENYLKLIGKEIELIFDRSPVCDSTIMRSFVENYAVNFSDKNSEDIYRILLTINIASYINYRDAAANLKRYSQLAANRNLGKNYGRPPGSKRESARAKSAKKMILKENKDFNGTLSDEECIAKAGVSRNMYYIYKRELRKEKQNAGI